jgi:hypothetical protein
MLKPMSRTIIVKYVNPWKFRREQERQRLSALRQRDGDDCRRCRRPLRFDLPRGHDMGPRIEEILTDPAEGAEELDNLCLCHGRCNAEAADHTSEVQERVRRKSEAELFAKSRPRKRA